MTTSLLRFIRRGTHEHLDEETNRRILVVNLFSLVGVSITLLLGLRALAAGS